MKTWEELTIADDFLFQKVMQNENICKKFIEKVLQKKIASIHYHQNEKTINLNPVRKSVRLDIFVETTDGVMIDVEMQTSDKKAERLPKRARYYQAMMDLNTLSKGASYKKLQESYIIFICTFDPFGKSQKVYTFTNKCNETDIELSDGATKIFYSTKGKLGDIDEDIENFLNYADNESVNGDFVKEVAREVEKLKAHDETRLEYMSFSAALMDERDDGEQAGIKKGMEKGIKKGMERGKFASNINSIRSIMSSFNVTLDKAMDVIKIPKSEQSMYREKIMAMQ